MNETLTTMLTWFVPLLAWLPLSGRDEGREPPVRGRPELYLILGAAAALPVLTLRMAGGPPAPTLTYLTAQSFFRALLLDGAAAAAIPLGVLVASTRWFGAPRDGGHGICRASLVLLGYSLVDGAAALGVVDGWRPAVASFLLAAPKLALAPVWGRLIAGDAEGAEGPLTLSALVFGSVLSGAAGFLWSSGYLGAAALPALLVFPAALVLRYRPSMFAGSTVDAEAQDSGGIGSGDVPAEDRRFAGASGSRPRHDVYRLMRDGRYSQARLEADRYLERHGDLALFAWQALLRWLGGESAYRVIFLTRYAALDEVRRRRIKAHLRDYLGSRSAEVAGWIRTLEAGEENQLIAS